MAAQSEEHVDVARPQGRRVLRRSRWEGMLVFSSRLVAEYYITCLDCMCRRRSYSVPPSNTIQKFREWEEAMAGVSTVLVVARGLAPAVSVNRKFKLGVRHA